MLVDRYVVRDLLGLLGDTLTVAAFAKPKQIVASLSGVKFEKNQVSSREASTNYPEHFENNPEKNHDISHLINTVEFDAESGRTIVEYKDGARKVYYD